MCVYTNINWRQFSQYINYEISIRFYIMLYGDAIINIYIYDPHSAIDKFPSELGKIENNRDIIF